MGDIIIAGMEFVVEVFRLKLQNCVQPNDHTHVYNKHDTCQCDSVTLMADIFIHARALYILEMHRFDSTGQQWIRDED